MYLVVTRSDPPARVDDEPAVDQLLTAPAKGDRSQMHPYPVVAGGGAHGGKHRVFAFDTRIAEGAIAIAVEKIGHLGGEEHRRPAGAGALYRIDQACRVGHWIDAALRLEDGDACDGHAARSASSFPSYSRVISASQPPT